VPVILKESSVAAGVTLDNLVAGSSFEFARTRQIVSVGVAQSVTGGFITINSGSDVVLERSSPPIKTVYPIIPDDMYFTDVMEQGDRLVISCANPTAGAIIFRGVVQITPV
jgi:hypothetical protein